MRRLTDVYAQLASDRDQKAGLCVAYVLERDWDRAAGAARAYADLQAQCSALVSGSLATLSVPEPDGDSAA